jgi:hypothetical protein
MHVVNHVRKELINELLIYSIHMSRHYHHHHNHHRQLFRSKSAFPSSAPPFENLGNQSSRPLLRPH